jgi:arylsulfatase A-like enzyme
MIINSTKIFTILLSLPLLLTLTIVSGQKVKSKKPNIIYIYADDLGYGELGIYGQEKIETPHLDQLGKDGKVFMQHYSSAPVCAPARYMLLTGKHSGHAYIRGNDEWRERGEVWDFAKAVQDSTLEGQRPVPAGTLFFPAILQKNGYSTALIGKWGLGAPHTHSIPSKMGFDYFFGYNCQRQAHTYYPTHLYENEKKYHLKNRLVVPGTKLKEGADPSKIDSYEAFNQNEYAPDVMFDKMISFLNQNKAQSFFVYWATPLPHNAIQAPQKWVTYYENKFGAEKHYSGQNGYFPHRSPRAGYAAQISYLDEQVGNLVSYLKKNNLFDNTIILFSSDNGATFSGGTDSPYFNSNGIHDEVYGKGKGFVYEGGIKVPFIAHWPGKIKPEVNSSLVTVQYDLFNTILDLAHIKTNQKNDGISFAHALLETGNQKKHDFFLWVFPEYGGQVAIRCGDWKLIRQTLKAEDKEPTLELYHLKNDPNEKNNIAANHPEIIKHMQKIFRNQYQIPETERFRIPLIDYDLLGQ